MDQVSFSGNEFSSVASPQVNMVDAAGGVTLWAFGVLVTVKIFANETGGLYSLFEDIVPPGSSPPLHIHTQEDETWYMIDGELDWLVGSQTFHATKGCFVHLPRLVPHKFINKSDKYAHMVLTYSPGGFERMFLDVGLPVEDRNAPGEPPAMTHEDLETAMVTMKSYGIILTGPGHTEEVIREELHDSL